VFVQIGDQGWSWKSLIPIWKSMENYDEGSDGIRGRDGPIVVRRLGKNSSGIVFVCLFLFSFCCVLFLLVFFFVQIGKNSSGIDMFVVFHYCFVSCFVCLLYLSHNYFATKSNK
jgi:hypothetical protein